MIGLEADHVVERAGHVVLAQLHDGMGPPPRARIAQPNRTHGAKGQRLHAPGCQRFDGHAAFEVALQLFVRALQLELGRRQNRLDKGFVLFLVQRTVDVVAFILARPAAAIIATLTKGDGHVDAVGHDNGRHGVIEIEMLLARQCLDLGSERGAGQRASGEDRGARGNVRRLFAPTW